MDIVLPWRRSKFNLDLRYCIRGLSNLPSHIFDQEKDKLIILGPESDFRSLNWDLLEAHKIYCEDVYQFKNSNSLAKVKFYCELCSESGCSEKFLLMNDDFFFLRPVDHIFNFVLNKDLRNLSGKNRNTAYALGIRNTIKWLNKWNYPKYNFEVHYPMIIDSTDFLDLFNMGNDEGPWLDLIEHPLAWRSLYGNIFIEDVVGLQKDFKIKRAAELNRSNLLDLDFVSTADNLEAKFAQRLQRFHLLSEKSKFEQPYS